MNLVHIEVGTDKSTLAFLHKHIIRAITIERNGEFFSHSNWQSWELDKAEEGHVINLIHFMTSEMDVLKEKILSEWSDAEPFTDSDKHNWFTVDGDIRISENITTKEMADKLDEAGFEFLGKIGYSSISDSDYE